MMKKQIVTSLVLFSLCAMVVGVAPKGAQAENSNGMPGEHGDLMRGIVGSSTAPSNFNDLLGHLQDMVRQVNELKAKIASLKHMGDGAGTTTHATGTPMMWGKGKHDGMNCGVLANLGAAMRGHKGEGVRSLQKFLVEDGDLDSDSATGFFGKKTENALKQWQMNNGVATSGVATSSLGFFGKRTREAMKMRCDNPNGKNDQEHGNNQGGGENEGRDGNHASSTVPNTPDSARASARARDALAAKLGIGGDTITITNTEAKTWTNGCLDLAPMGMMCTDVMVPGFRVTLTASSTTYYAHTDARGKQVRFEGLI